MEERTLLSTFTSPIKICPNPFCGASYVAEEERCPSCKEENGQEVAQLGLHPFLVGIPVTQREKYEPSIVISKLSKNRGYYREVVEAA